MRVLGSVAPSVGVSLYPPLERLRTALHRRIQRSKLQAGKPSTSETRNGMPALAAGIASRVAWGGTNLTPSALGAPNSASPARGRGAYAPACVTNFVLR